MQKYLQRRAARWLQAAGRLRPGVTLEQARAQLGSLWPEIRQEMVPPDKTFADLGRFRDLQLKVESGASGEASLLRKRFSQPLYIVLAISGLVREMLHDPARVELASKASPVAGLTQTVYAVPNEKKTDLFLELLKDVLRFIDVA